MLAQRLYSQSRYLWLIVIVILLVGASSFQSLGRQEDPTLTNLFASITAFLPGAEPARVEALVTRPLEEELRKISEVKEVSSTSSTGVSSLTVELHQTLLDEEIERAWSEVRDALGDASINFPAGTPAPLFDNDRTTAFVRIIAMTSAPGRSLSRPLLSRLADDFAQRARNFPGTKLVEVFGESREEVRVDIDEQALLSRNISINEVTSALRGADPRVSSGRATGQTSDLLIEIAGEFDSPARVASVIVRIDSQGNAVTVGDLARVYRAEQTPPRAVAITNGSDGILLGIAMDDGLQVDNWSAQFESFLSSYRNEAPAGLLIESAYNQASYTEERLSDVTANLAIGVSLVLVVLLFTLGMRAAAVVAFILPLCTLISLVLMNQIGLPIHQMSLTGLVVALGLLVDGSIVMTDEVRKHLLAGETALDAIAASVARLKVPLLSSTATTILAFAPMVVLPGPAGDFLGSIAKAVVLMLGSSLLLALVITPVLAAYLLPNGLKKSKNWWEVGIGSGKPGQWLSGAVDWSIRYPLGSIMLALALPVAGFLSFSTLTAQFFPGTDRDQFVVKVTLPPGRSINDTYRLVESLDTRLREESIVRRVDWTIGESAPQFYYNLIRNRDGIPGYAQANVLTSSILETDDLIRKLQRDLDIQYPSARILVIGLDQGPPVSAPLEIEIYGENLEVLRRLGEEFRLRMERVVDVTHSTTSLVAGAPKLVFELDEQRVRLAGLDLATVARTMDSGLRGSLGGEIIEGTERLPVRARLNETDWSDPEQIASIRLPLGGASVSNDARVSNEEMGSISLSTLGSFTLQPSSSPITRKNGSRRNLVQGFLTRGVLPEESLKELQQILLDDPVSMPVGYRYSFGGDAEERASVVADIAAPMGLVMAAMLATIVLTFNSWRLTAVAFSVFGLSMGLSLLSLAIFRYPFGVQALIGVIGSIGVSINAAIIILTALQQDAGAMSGRPEAVRAVVMDSSRHIVSTTVTTFGGFLPLILEGGGFWPPFAMSIAGGVLLSTIVSFFYVPPMFMLVYKRRHKRQQLKLTQARDTQHTEQMNAA